MGGFSEPAFRRAARLGDGFIFASRDYATLEPAWARVRALLAETAPPEAAFGRDYIGLGATSAEDVADCLKRWRDADGAHGTISSLGRGFTDIRQHIDFVGEVVGEL